MAPDWEESIRFDVFLFRLATETGDYAYFHNARGQLIAKRYVFNQIDKDTKDKLGEICQVSADANKQAMETLKNNIESTQIDQSLPEDIQKQNWESAILAQNEQAKKAVNQRMDDAAQEAIEVIRKLPESTQPSAATAYQVGVNLVMTAFEFLASKVRELYNHVVDFIQKIWDTVVMAYEAVLVWVDGVKDKIRDLFGLGSLALAEANGAVDRSDPNVSQAVKLLLSLVYSFRIPHEEVVASTDRIWDSYLTRYFESTSAQEPQNVSVSRKPKPEGDRDTDGKLMFISWHVGGDTGTGRELIEPVVQSEQKALAGSYSGGLRYNIVDMGDSSKATQRKRGVGKQQDVALRSQKREAHY